MPIEALPVWYLGAIATLVGLCVGSFLNVCVARWPAGESVVSPGSHCPVCDTPIKPYDNIPLVGWIILRGRCRSCGNPISPIYPIIEAATGGLWLVAFLRYGLTWTGLSTAILLTILLGIALTDAKHYLIPDQFSVGGAVIGLLFSFAPGGITPLSATAGAALGFGLLYLVAVVGEWALKKPAMGGGDIKMMAMIGAFLGPTGAALSIFLGALLGTIVFLPLSLKSQRLIPFGIFLSLGAATFSLWGELVVEWYLALVL